MRLKAAGSNTKYVIDDSGKEIGAALKLSNERWAPFTHDEKTRLVATHINFKSPNDVLKFFLMNSNGR